MKKSMMENNRDTNSSRTGGSKGRGTDKIERNDDRRADVSMDDADDLEVGAEGGRQGGKESASSGRGRSSASAARTEGMDALELLHSHHQEVESLFQEFERTGSGAARGRKAILQELALKIEAHAKIEEKLFYPKGRKADEILTLECYEEHKLCRVLLRSMLKLGSTDKELIAKAHVLKELIQHHVREEEREFFEKIKQRLGQDELRRLGVELKTEYDRIVARGSRKNVRGDARAAGRAKNVRTRAGRTGNAAKSASTGGNSGRGRGAASTNAKKAAAGRKGAAVRNAKRGGGRGTSAGGRASGRSSGRSGGQVALQASRD